MNQFPAYCVINRSPCFEGRESEEVRTSSANHCQANPEPNPPQTPAFEPTDTSAVKMKCAG